MNNYELEKTIIAALLNDFDKAQTTHLNSEWFMIDDFKKIFEILNNYGSRLDGIMELFAKLQVESKGQGINYEKLLEIQKDYLVGTSLDYLANELHLTFLRSQFSKLTAEHSQFPTKKTEAQMLEILNMMNKLSRKQNAGDLEETFKQFEYELENDVEEGVKTFSGLDGALGGGIGPGMLITVGARPSVGKSAWTINLIDRALRRNEGLRVDLFSLEMNKKEVFSRFVAKMTTLNTYFLRKMNRMLKPDDKELVRETIEYFKQKDLKVYDTISELNQILGIIKERSSGREAGKYLAVIDYVGLIKVNNNRDRRLQIEQITRELKNIANEYQVPIVILSQLSRGIEQRQDKTPMLADLRESGSIEQDSNVVCFLSNEETEENHEGYQRVKFSIKKNREGDLMDSTFKFYKAQMNFVEEFERR